MTKLLLSAIFSGLIILGTIATFLRFLRGDKHMFRFFTILSNCFSALVSVPVLIVDVLVLSGQLEAWPERLIWLRFVSAVAVMVTMLTVVFFLAPLMGKELLYKNDNLYMHVIGPLLAAVAFIAFEPGTLGLARSLIGMQPVLLYGLIYLCKAVFIGEERGGWPDFYGFNKGGRWPISFAAMMIASAALSLLMAWAHNLL